MASLRSNSRLSDKSFRAQLYLGLGQLGCHLSLIYPVLHFSKLYFAWSLFLYFCMTCIGVSITAHRCLAHRSIQMPVPFLWIGLLFFTLSLQGSSLAWVAMHREHHLYADRRGDPHDPNGKFWSVYFLSMFYTPRLRYILDLLRNPAQRIFHEYYWHINIAYGLLMFSIFDIRGAVYFYLLPACLCWHGISFAKTFAHAVGYRNFETRDQSRNLPLVGYLTFGEGWHNNHHADPAHYNFQRKWHEIDVSSILIEIGCQLFGFRKRERRAEVIQ